MIDLHTHVLPGLDDGPKNLEESLALATAAAAAGTTVMVATPHIDRHWRVDPSRVSERVADLSAALRAAEIPLELRAGGEIDIARLAGLRSKEIAALRLGGGPYLLLECPLATSTWDFDEILLKLRARGEDILLAHPERCPLFQREPDRLVRLVEAGLLTSITAGSMWGQFGERVREFTTELLRAGMVHDVASDSHGAARRPPGLGKAFPATEQFVPGITRRAEWLTVLMPAAILTGEPLPLPPPLD